VNERVISTVKRVESPSDRMSYMILRGLCCDITLSIHAPTEDKTDDVKNRFSEEFEYMLDSLNTI
jgi:phage gp36-like protein